MATDAAPLPERESPRFELKWAAERHALEPLRSMLLLDPCGLRTLYPPRRVQSLYFDTASGEALAENLAGVSERRKLRMRWYGEQARGVRATLEIKARRNQLGWKERVEVPEKLDIEGASKAGLQREIARQLPPLWRDRVLGGLEIVQWITYEREYFGSADGKARITIDRALTCFDQRFRSRLSRRFRTPLPDVVVIELKAAREDYDAIEPIANRLPVFISKCSKFVMASSDAEAPPISHLPDRER